MHRWCPSWKSTIKPDGKKVIKVLVDGDVREATGINSTIETINNIENFYYKKTEKTVEINSFSCCDGAVVFCELAKKIEYSGIYVGNGQIVELNGDGWIRKVNPVTFYSDSQYRTGNEIYTFTDFNGKVLCSEEIARRARGKVGTKVDYSIISENCHQFSVGCLTGNFSNLNITFTQLLELMKKIYGNYEIRKVKFY